MSEEIIYREIPQSEIIINPVEKAARLKTKVGYTDEIIERCEKLLRETAVCRFSAVRRKAVFHGDGRLDIGFGDFKSHDLYKNLFGCREVFLFAVTIGLEVDRLLYKLSVSSPAEHFVTDGLSSAMAEAACCKADEILREGLICRPRFSAGYGDFPLETQPEILRITEAGRLLNIMLGKSLLMTPMKSITAVIGIE